MRTGKTLTVECRCGYRLFRYFKDGRGALIKCFISKLVEDNVGLTGAPTLSKPVCPQCGRELGIIMMIRGLPALKINQGTIRSIRL
jgi:hypothetical protein